MVQIAIPRFIGGTQMVIYFEGAAGTGKTTNMLQELLRQLAQNPLDDFQKVLALSYMHGARLRLLERLSLFPELKNKHRVCTIDSFAWHLANRWRTLALKYGWNGQNSCYDRTCEVAADLLKQDIVLSWVTCVYPIVVVDEAQDCKGVRFEILKNLARASVLIAAADEFQDLQAAHDVGHVEWLRQAGQSDILKENKRTDNEELVRLSRRIREGQDISELSEFILAMPSPQQAAADIYYGVKRIGKKGDIVLITPVGIDRSHFVKGIDEWLRKNGLFVDWETSENALLRSSEKCLLDMGGDDSLTIGQVMIGEDFPGKDGLLDWMERKRRLKGQTCFSKNELLIQLERVIHDKRLVAMRKRSRLRGLNVHQAKNREFDYVFILWPYQVGGNAEVQRRLLYNAVTRARKMARILVQSKNTTRVDRIPFRQQQ
jgi:hypothetical protein